MGDLKEIKDSTNNFADLKDKLFLDIKKDFELNEKIKKDIKADDKNAASKLNYCIRNTRNILDILVKLQILERSLSSHVHKKKVSEQFNFGFDFDE